jgi:hypothetical protein
LGIEGKMIAATGFQKKTYEKSDLITTFKEVLSRSDKILEFTASELRSAKDIFNKGGHVMMLYKDQNFRLLYDNRRRIIEPQNFKNDLSVDASTTLMDSEPLTDINHCKTLRFLSKFPVTNPYNKNNANRSKTGYKTYLEIAVRNFIKAYYSQNLKFGLKGTEFRFVKDMINFIFDCKLTKNIKVSQQSISNLKNRLMILQPVPDTSETYKFALYVQSKFPYFDIEKFMKPKIM